MKTIKIIIFMLLCIPFNIYALNYKYQDVYTPDDNYLIKEEKLYKFYEEEREYTTDYYLENDNPKDYPYKSTITKEVTSDYLEEKPQENLNRNITTYNLTGYYSLKPINRIELRGIKSSKNYLYLTEVTIWYKKEKINSTIHCYDCGGRIESYLNDNNYTSTNGYLSFSSVLEIEFDTEYNPSDLEIGLYFYNPSDDTTFSVYYYDKDIKDKFNYNSNTSYYDYIKFDVNLSDAKYYKTAYVEEYKLSLTKDNIKKYKWDTKIIETEEKLNEDFYQKVNNKVMYKYTDTLYKYYKINKVYLKDYLLEAPSYIKDETDYITRYLYIEKENNNSNISSDVCNILEKTNNIKDELVEEKNVINNITNPSTFYKIRHIYLVIIIITLILMGYMLYSLRKE